MAQQAGPAFATNPPLERAVHADITDLVLWAGQILLQHGAECQRVEETMHRLGTALGCDRVDTFISANGIIVTTVSGGDFRTRVRRVVDQGVNMTMVSAINRLSRRIEGGELDRAQVRAELERISTMPNHYHRWLVVVMVGLSCAAFSRLFGGDWAVFGVTFCASAVAILVRQELTRRHVNLLLTVVISAFVAGLLASSATWLQLSEQPQIALSAAVLFLVPGVLLINAVDDLVTGYPVVGMSRAAVATLIVLAIALGLSLAMYVAGAGDR